MSPIDFPFWDTVDRIRERDPRFGREAYGFVMAALGATVRGLPPERLADPERRHLTGRELLDGVVRFARGEFGLLARAVFEEWGVRHGEDVGAIVFHLVASGELSARPEDSIEDFRGGPPLALLLTENLEVGAALAGSRRAARRAGGPGGPA